MITLLVVEQLSFIHRIYLLSDQLTTEGLVKSYRINVSVNIIESP